MRKIEALIEYIKTEIHPEIANGFWNKYKDSDDHIKFEYLKYSFLVYDEKEHFNKLKELIEEEIYEINFAIEKSEFKHISKYINWDLMIEDEMKKHPLLSDFDWELYFDWELDFGEKINNYYIYIYD